MIEKVMAILGLGALAACVGAEETRTLAPAGEFDVASRDVLGDALGPISFAAFADGHRRAGFMRDALTRHALERARAQGLGTSLRRAGAAGAAGTSGEWWARGVAGADLLPGEAGRRVALPDAIYAAVEGSTQIAAFGDLPAIRATAIEEARGRFVPELFAELSREEETDLVSATGGARRVVTDRTEAEVGVRSRLITGGEVALSQRATRLDTDRVTLAGEDEGSQTIASITQPVLRGAGAAYNDAPRRIAQLDAAVAVEEFRRQSEAHLLEVERAYWNVYLARAVLLQKRRLAAASGSLAGRVAARAGVDADVTLVSRAQAAARRAEADTVRARSALGNAERRLAALVGDRRFGPSGVEIVPASAPSGRNAVPRVADAVADLIARRPEIRQALLGFEAALMREGAAANEALPELDLVLRATVAGDDQLGDALDDEDGSLAALRFSVPLGFDERDARYKRRRIETVQQARQVMAAVDAVLLEVDVTANELAVAGAELAARRQALAAARADRDALRARFEGGGGGAGIDLLSALVSSEEALQAAEQAVVEARVTREVATASLALARGLLLERWGIEAAPGGGTYRLARRG